MKSRLANNIYAKIQLPISTDVEMPPSLEQLIIAKIGWKYKYIVFIIKEELPAEEILL